MSDQRRDQETSQLFEGKMANQPERLDEEHSYFVTAFIHNFLDGKYPRLREDEEEYMCTIMGRIDSLGRPISEEEASKLVPTVFQDGSCIYYLSMSILGKDS